jgi:hypothetical protein
MTTEERFERIEKQLERMGDQLEVFVKLQETGERRWEERFDRLASIVLNFGMAEKNLYDAVTHTADAVAHIADLHVTTLARIDSLIQAIENFVRGQRTNGEN